jgi:uncharacterized protein (DUF2062 family)
MLFKRRDRIGLVERFRVWLWPRVSWRRSTLYFFKRILRLSATPYAISMGAAAGAFTSCTPFIGFHFILAACIAFVLRGNLIASAIGTSVGNPLTFPVIWLATYKLGNIVLGGTWHAEPEFGEHFYKQSFEQLWPLIKPMTIGAVPIGLAIGLITYLIVYQSVSVYQARRRMRFQSIRKKRIDASAEQTV